MKVNFYLDDWKMFGFDSLDNIPRVGEFILFGKSKYKVVEIIHSYPIHPDIECEIIIKLSNDC